MIEPHHNLLTRLRRPQFTRIGRGPLFKPDLNRSWQAGGVFAPAVVKDGDQYRMVFRAYGNDRISRVGYAESQDGRRWQVTPEPIVVPDAGDEQERFGLEDPRITRLGDKFYITVTAADGHTRYNNWYWKTRVIILATQDFKQFERIYPELPDKNNKDAVLFPEKVNNQYWLLHRIMPQIWISHSSDLVRWQDHTPIATPTDNSWESLRIGAGAQPIKTDDGWLLFYHGVSQTNVYCMSAMLLDLNNPAQVTHRLNYPLLEPIRSYEEVGVVPRVVFGTSALEWNRREYWLYYGAADTSIALAKIDKKPLLKALLSSPTKPDLTSGYTLPRSR